jgi:hypothetical protein
MAITLPRSIVALAGMARFHVRYPGAAVEISPEEVTAVLVRRERGAMRLVGYGVRSLANEAPEAPGAATPEPAAAERFATEPEVSPGDAGSDPVEAADFAPERAADDGFSGGDGAPNGPGAHVHPIGGARGPEAGAPPPPDGRETGAAGFAIAAGGGPEGTAAGALAERSTGETTSRYPLGAESFSLESLLESGLVAAGTAAGPNGESASGAGLAEQPAASRAPVSPASHAHPVPHPSMAPAAPPPADLKEALVDAVKRAGIKGGRCSLILPDSAARVWLLQFPEIPRGQQAVLEMIRWKVRRSIALRIEDCLISYQIVSRPSAGRQGTILAGLLPRATVHQYESMLADADLKIGLVDLSSFNLYNLVRHQIRSAGGGAESLAVLNATTAYFTLMIFRREELVFYRCKMHPEGDGLVPGERAKTFRRELAASLSYYTEKLKGVKLDHTIGRVVDPALYDSLELLPELGYGTLQRIDGSAIAKFPDGMDERTRSLLLPAVGATLGRR